MKITVQFSTTGSITKIIELYSIAAWKIFFFTFLSFFFYIYILIYIISLFEHFVTRSRCILFPVVLNTMWSNTTRPYIQGGCLTSVYDLCSMVFHWGHSNEEGSEHTFDYVRFPMELQVWHIKRGFNSLLDAITAKENDGILIVSFFFQVQSLFFSFIFYNRIPS